jgi:hypothetical protein
LVFGLTGEVVEESERHLGAPGVVGGNHAEHVEGNVIVRTRMNYNISLFTAAVAAMALDGGPDDWARATGRSMETGA